MTYTNKQGVHSMEIEKIIKDEIANMTDRMLCDIWEKTNKDDSDSIPEARGFLMDEIEKRYPDKFDAWMETDDIEKMESPRFFIL